MSAQCRFSSERPVTVVLDGRSLTLEEVVRVAREAEPVALAPEAREAMRRARDVEPAPSRAVTRRMASRPGSACGSTSGSTLRGHERLLVQHHLIAQGPSAPRDVVRATALRLANALAQGTTIGSPGARGAGRHASECRPSSPSSARSARSARAILPRWPTSPGGCSRGSSRSAGEGIALVNQNAFATAWGALAVSDALRLLDAVDVAGALDLEAFGAAGASLDPAIGELPAVPRAPSDARAPRGAARGQRASEPQPAGSTRLSHPPAGARGGARRIRVRRATARDRAQRRTDESRRHTGRGVSSRRARSRSCRSRPRSTSPDSRWRPSSRARANEP